jgi:apolipoprotein N-acyltransferase
LNLVDNFEKLYKKKVFSVAVIFFHIYAMIYFFWQLNERQKFTAHDIVVTLNILALAIYWKLYAKVKKKKFEEKEK